MPDNRLNQYQQKKSPFYNDRPEILVDLLVIHNISLPAGQFSTPYVHDLFMGCLDSKADKSFADLDGVEVSSHFFIARDGVVTQFVAMDKRAWHAGVSSFDHREGCNDFSIGIELEGTDILAFESAQYVALLQLTLDVMHEYPGITPARIVGHSEIAPGRKTDPGPAFEWPIYRAGLMDALNDV
ncbi:MAG: 1,6-anhydro-N-acetylmuramyl-L-alanine amidase AmpD [Pseudomonadales bacterium]|nr:1,6-anhydro-N-acetylmuramyl-L-alanine amidase AmpD [Pseudomonadales bacterium]